jgi:hypothetical protein
MGSIAHRRGVVYFNDQPALGSLTMTSLRIGGVV